jgi:hypothetical protein
MSAIFQRPLCDMGKAYDYSFRPVVGDPDTGTGGGCDERPHRVELYAALTNPTVDPTQWRPFGLCAEHESQLRASDAKVQTRGLPSRFRTGPTGTRVPGRPERSSRT